MLIWELWLRMTWFLEAIFLMMILLCVNPMKTIIWHLARLMQKQEKDFSVDGFEDAITGLSSGGVPVDTYVKGF